ncbi:NAD(P)/FAD-dependent oxidoreductase [Ornithinimicrobium cryptoxanthini]|uniref:FAD-dependent oxidoreductase n=1 Tax=Ornithinimicrobium cryptoxanthini TaxID=2934161 RepID=A0ABY4YLG0_9MICO|nr:FAD-dependent oxidoreductase [Ornithinimicrobium cryptoxanthini]USQ77638.1 FAD-dependent oxidoreductase [Ornithinimicrobium cryptoxanthini]
MTTQHSAPAAGVVVIGAGLAGAHVVESLRAHDYAGPITLVGDETDRPYERPPLSKGYLQGQAEIDEAYVHPAGWYAEHDVTTRLGEEAVAIDRDAHEVELAGGERIAYQELVVATGATPRRLPLPGSDLSGVLTLRRIADSDAIKEAIAAHSRIVIIGGGWIGLEVAAAARAGGCEVAVIESSELPLLAVLGPQVAGHFAQLHRDQGVDLRTGASCEAFTGEDGRVTGVVVDGETFPADVVVVGIGAAPNTDLAAAAGLTVESGVVTDEHLRSVDDRDILAVGDVAEAQNTLTGHLLRVEHWDNAIRQGKLAGAVIAGGDDAYDWAPYFFTDQFDLGMEYVGHGREDDDVVIRGELGSGEFIAFWLRDGTVSAAMNVNIWDVNEHLRALIGTEVAPERLADSDVELTDL